MADIIIKNVEDLKNYCERILENLEAEDNIDLSQFQDGLKLHITGSRYDSSLDTSIMEYFVTFQKNINDVYSIRKHGKIQKLSDEEKEQLRVFVQIRPGSAIAEVKDFLDIISMVSGGDIRMNAGTTTILTLGAVAFVGYVGYKIWAQKSRNVIAKKRLELDAQKTELDERKTELEKRKTELDAHKMELEYEIARRKCQIEEQRNDMELKRCERDARQFEAMEKIFDTAMENHAKMFRALASPKDAKIAIGEQEIAPEALKDEGTMEKMPEPQWTETISGLCKVLDITFDYGTETSFATIRILKTGEIIDKVNLQDCFLSPEKLAFIKEAEKKEPIELTINVNRKGKKVENAYLKLEGYINDDPSLRR